MTAATLFSGIGAPELAMPSWDWIWHAEIEKFPAAVMASRFPHSVNLGDVTADDFCERALAIGRPDVVVFGSPCQSYSIAGKRLGLDDPRGNLALVALGIVARIKPAWFLFENVPGLLSSSEGRDFGLFLRAVEECGHSLSWRLLDAQYFGLAQRRKRLFAVGHPRDWRGPAAILFEQESLCGYPPSREEARQGITGTLAPGAHPGSYNGQDAYSGQLIAHALRGEGMDASEDGTGRGTPLVAFTMKDCGADASEELSPTLRSGGHTDSHANSGVMPAVAFGWNKSASQTMRVDRETTDALQASETSNPAVAIGWTGDETPKFGVEVSPTLRAEQGGEGVGVGVGVRRLTPKECERLQGIPDDHTLITYRGKPAADGPRYKAIGNSMAVPVVRWILTRLEFVDALLKGKPEAAA